MLGGGAGGSLVEMSWVVDELIESLSWEWSVRKESSESSHGGASLVEVHICILIAHAWPLGFLWAGAGVCWGGRRSMTSVNRWLRTWIVFRTSVI